MSQLIFKGLVSFLPNWLVWPTVYNIWTNRYRFESNLICLWFLMILVTSWPVALQANTRLSHISQEQRQKQLDIADMPTASILASFNLNLSQPSIVFTVYGCYFGSNSQDMTTIFQPLRYEEILDIYCENSKDYSLKVPHEKGKWTYLLQHSVAVETGR